MPQERKKYNSGQDYILLGITKGIEPYVLNEIANTTEQDIIFIAKDRAAGQLTLDTLTFLSDREIIFFPEWDTLPYDNISPSKVLLHQRIKALYQLTSTSGRSKIILTTSRAFVQRTIPKQELINYIFSFEVGKNYHRTDIINLLIANGYLRSSCVTTAEEFAVRGSIIDIASDEIGVGYRIDFFGDRIELIKKFDLYSQATIESVDVAYITPSSELIISDKTRQRFKKYLVEKGYKENDYFDFVDIHNHLSGHGVENFLPCFYKAPEVIADYLINPLIVFDTFAKQEINAFLDMASSIYTQSISKSLEGSQAVRSKECTQPYMTETESRRLTNQEFERRRVYQDKCDQSLYLPPDKLWLSQDDLTKCLCSLAVIEFSIYNSPDNPQDTFQNCIHTQIKSIPTIKSLIKRGSEYFSEFNKFIKSQLATYKNVVISCLTKGSKDRVMRLLADHGIEVYQAQSVPAQGAPFLNAAQIILSPIRCGAITNDYCLVAEEDIFGQKVQAIFHKRRNTIHNALGLEPAFALCDLVVHRDYGIGMFQGLEMLQLANSKHDCLKISYADNEVLFIPIENMEVLTKHGEASNDSIKLDKLGTTTWAVRKARAKDKINEMAKGLMTIAAQRSMKILEAIYPNAVYEKFCANFPYIETEDQERAIKDIIEDLAQCRPMDRLICGDTGFGKTEVVMRAACMVISQNSISATRKMVVMICPTTLLCRQNYNVFQARFKNTSAKIVQLSRLTTTTNRNDAIEAINAGDVDIVIGTHALLNDKICYDRLALLIIDEEHRFGVAQKEKLKSLRKDTHIVSLSATPIPRTLQMSLTGIRELSLITTPPMGRLNTKISVISFDVNKIKEALLKEKMRGGQIFYICPRISDLGELTRTLATSVPEITVRKVHGQMSPRDLNTIVSDFYDGKFDLLLSTSIVESGLDIPKANTIIVHRSDLFGLAQLYQLKGRVGRSNIEAFAYFTVPSGSLNEITLRRLQILQNSDELGSGFAIASHDMELRGFGNLVGDKQAGHIKDIGLELYQHMFEEALNEIKITKNGQDRMENHASSNFSPQINVDAPILIPEEYIKDLDLRLELYNRISRLQNEEEIMAMGAELIDRFGPIPQELEHLLSIISLKRLCMAMFIEKINLGSAGISIKFLQSHLPIIADALMNFVSASGKTIKVKSNDTLLLELRIENSGKRIHTVKKFLAHMYKEIGVAGNKIA